MMTIKNKVSFFTSVLSLSSLHGAATLGYRSPAPTSTRIQRPSDARKSHRYILLIGFSYLGPKAAGPPQKPGPTACDIEGSGVHEKRTYSWVFRIFPFFISCCRPDIRSHSRHPSIEDGARGMRAMSRPWSALELFPVDSDQ